VLSDSTDKRLASRVGYSSGAMGRMESIGNEYCSPTDKSWLGEFLRNASVSASNSYVRRAANCRTGQLFRIYDHLIM
jgi:hypothetical protein